MDGLKKAGEFEWEVPVEGEMKVPGKIFASESLIGQVDRESVSQIRDVACLPGILGASLAMPDLHRGYGFCIGGVGAFDIDEGVICPGGVGYDINCSVRLIASNLMEKDIVGREKEIVSALKRRISSGVGGRGISLSGEELDGVLRKGALWAVENGFGNLKDLERIEDGGVLDCADVGAVSEVAKKRGLSQLGTLGGGNHFLDVLVVDEVFDECVAEKFGLKKGQVVVMIHCGSRGLGHQVASDYIKEMGGKGLVGVPFKSEVGQRYFGAMCAAANFAFANKQVIACEVEDELRKFFPDLEMDIVYEVCHNIAKVERHGGRDVLVMRKGATRAFGAGRVEVCEDYRDVGQPVLLPGSMGTFSYVLVGGGRKDAWESCSHGAGRAMSRKEASDRVDFGEAVCGMERRGVFVEGGKRGMIEEAPSSYKDIEEVVGVCEGVGLGRRVVGLRPRMVVIG